MKPEINEQFREYCRHIVQWGERIPQLIGKRTFDEFASDQATHLAVWKCVEVLGEASVRILKLDREFETRYPKLQLRQAYAMRNQLTHGYTTVDLGTLWTTANTFTPLMVAEAKSMLGDTG